MKPKVRWPLVVASVVLALIVALCIYDKLYLDGINYYLHHFLFTSAEPTPPVTTIDPDQKRSRVLFVTFDNRPDAPFVKMHNESLQRYCQAAGHTYLFLSDGFPSDIPVYWYKVLALQKYLGTGEYDCVCWLDSDTVVVNQGYDVQQLLSSYPLSHIFLGRDEPVLSIVGLDSDIIKSPTLNAGFLMVRNTDTGRAFVDDCVDHYYKNRSKCVDPDTGAVRGLYATTCYEQGAIDELVWTKYEKETAFLSNDLIKNTFHCKPKPETFILHVNFTSAEYREQCFAQFLF